ncbi:hypothetical protein Tco_0414968 [Tanacetum coccineum]
MGLCSRGFTVGQDALKATLCKVTKHEKVCIENQHVFIPFAFDTFGFLAPEAVELLSRVQRVMHGNVMTPRFMDVVIGGVLCVCRISKERKEQDELDDLGLMKIKVLTQELSSNKDSHKMTSLNDGELGFFGKLSLELRYLLDGVLIANEAYDYLKKEKKKAFFLKIEACQTLTLIFVLVNGSHTPEFKMERGLDKVTLYHLLAPEGLNVPIKEVYGFGVQNREIEAFANHIGISSKKMPFTYLGILIGVNMERVDSRNIVVDKINKIEVSRVSSRIEVPGFLTHNIKVVVVEGYHFCPMGNHGVVRWCARVVELFKRECWETSGEPVKFPEILGLKKGGYCEFPKLRNLLVQLATYDMALIAGSGGSARPLMELLENCLILWLYSKTPTTVVLSKVLEAAVE